MTYNLLLTGDADPVQFAAVIAEAFRLDPASVEVAAEDDDSRTWDADVSCEYTRVHGDVTWSLVIYAAETVAERPTEGSLALRFARALNAATLFPADEKLPSVWRIATPAGETAYARLAEPEDDDGEFRVTESEIRIPGLPHAAVSPFPDVIREMQLPTPITDRIAATEDVRGLLVNWERLTVRAETGWPPSGAYPASLYLEDLRLRDRITSLAQNLPEQERDGITSVVAEVDAKYRRVTVDDGGVALAEATGTPVDDLVAKPWYWLRRPTHLPC
ncbi:hypothetical protein RM780_23355 [Streptomyces sp. DSM 44917]|uniref:PE-PGRS family protein n=1 Tax=Streptomyces boetiae TaxID=3075541 RepID=A0ABU2LED2_9ACTN|nr:hypothetical protein [Streptomyces sp. DSM 44917]MDT0309867.1 hypothetical protein [Streptomyces sp. DSM 44917]